MKSYFHFFMIQNSLQEKNNGWEFNYIEQDYLGSKLDHDIIDSNSGKVLAKYGDKFNSLLAKDIKKEGIKKLFVDDNSLLENI